MCRGIRNGGFFATLNTHWLPEKRVVEGHNFLKGVTQYLLQICIWTNKMHKILVIRLYFLLDVLNVSDYISPSSGATL